MPGLELHRVVPGGLTGVRLDARGEGPLLAVEAELAHRAELGEEGVPLIASRQTLCENVFEVEDKRWVFADVGGDNGHSHRVFFLS